MSEQLIQWEPTNGVLGKYTLDLITYTFQEFSLILYCYEDNPKKICVYFEESVSAYKSTNTNIWLANNINKFNDERTYLNWTFFKVMNSSYLSWISENTCGVYPQEGYVHFSFITTNVVVDVLNFDEPKIEVVEE